MKKKFSLGILATALLMTGTLAACGGGGNNGGNSSNPASSANNTSSSTQAGGSSNAGSSKSSSSQGPVEFSFRISLSNGSAMLNKDEEANIIIDAQGGDPNVVRNYSFSSRNPTIADVDDTGKVTALAEGTATIIVRESVSVLQQSITITVIDAQPASGGYNYASASGSEAIARRTEILGNLEKYAMDNHLTGITLFENGGYVKYSERVKLPTTNYITGYGFGLLSEGSLEGPMANESNDAYKMYLHSATSTDPKMINARNNTGSQVSDLEGYITASFWGTKLNSKKDGYEWYPVLAKEKVTFNNKEYDFNRPIPVFNGQEVAPDTKAEDEPNPLGLYSTWRIYVKTNSVKFRYNGNAWDGAKEWDGSKGFNGRPITLADYEFAYRLLLTGSHNLKRGPEAAADQTYGIVGAQRYNANTANATDEQAEELWDSMKASGQLGVQTGTDENNGDYIQLTLVNPIDRFTAMYVLSSNLYSPMSEDFIKAIGGGSVKVGAPVYGQMNNNNNFPAIHQGKILDFTLSVGPYMLEDWEKGQTIIFKRNDQWNEPNRYKIAGVKLVVIDTSSDSSAIYKRFTNTKDLDSCGIPIKYIETEKGKPFVYKTKGDSTFKLNVNSCTKSMWNELFGPGGKISTKGGFTANWDVKPWMSNDNFLNGIFYSINREKFANDRGVQPSFNYFADSYLSDPENGVSYNSTPEHAAAIEAYQTYDSDGKPTYGYSKDRAILSFKAAVQELLDYDYEEEGYPDNFRVKRGSKDNPFVMKIHIKWMNPTDITDYGTDIKQYIESAFNDPRVCDNSIKLEVEQSSVPKDQWEQVYEEVMMKGQFDLGFGSISGNTYNPLNFLEVLKSDNSSGFTLNWGTDTSKNNPLKPLIYGNKLWSFDALWAVADHGGVVNNGEIAKLVETCYLETGNINKFYEGATFNLVIKFIDVETAKLDITRIQIFHAGGGFDLTWDDADKVVDGTKMTVRLTLSPEDAAQINADIQRVNNVGEFTGKEPNLKPNPNYDPEAFCLEKYNVYWDVEVSYSLAIKAENSDKFGTPVENFVTAAKNKAAWIDD